MLRSLVVVTSILLGNLAYGQSADDYFPLKTGNQWHHDYYGDADPTAPTAKKAGKATINGRTVSTYRIGSFPYGEDTLFANQGSTVYAYSKVNHTWKPFLRLDVPQGATYRTTLPTMVTDSSTGQPIEVDVTLARKNYVQSMNRAKLAHSMRFTFQRVGGGEYYGITEVIVAPGFGLLKTKADNGDTRAKVVAGRLQGKVFSFRIPRFPDILVTHPSAVKLPSGQMPPIRILRGTFPPHQPNKLEGRQVSFRSAAAGAATFPAAYLASEGINAALSGSPDRMAEAAASMITPEFAIQFGAFTGASAGTSASLRVNKIQNAIPRAYRAPITNIASLTAGMTVAHLLAGNATPQSIGVSTASYATAGYIFNNPLLDRGVLRVVAAAGPHGKFARAVITLAQFTATLNVGGRIEQAVDAHMSSQE